jgi:hypothetical protein
VLSRFGRAKLIVSAVLSVVLIGASADAASQQSVTVRRCGYIGSSISSRSAIYPWHMSCAAARKVVTKSDHAPVEVLLTVAGGGEVMRIAGQNWVCGGLMGYYNCGYPYRPKRVDGQKGYEGPFTKDVGYQTCSSIVPKSSGCRTTAVFTQPRS